MYINEHNWADRSSATNSGYNTKGQSKLSLEVVNFLKKKNESTAWSVGHLCKYYNKPMSN